MKNARSFLRAGHWLGLAAACAALLALGSACTSRLLHRGQFSVLYARQQRASRPPDPQTVRVFIDRAGDLYPDLPAQLPLRDAFIKGRGSALYDYYHNQPHAVEATGDANSLRTLALAYGINYDRQHQQGQPDLDIWRQVQATLVQRHVQALNTRLRKAAASQRPLIILIHGFNVGPDAHIVHGQRTGLYDQVRVALGEIDADKVSQAVFLEVFWDGLQKPTPVGIWAGAQLNARYAGLRLRQVVEGVDLPTPIRVFTHSSGAIVATHTFWNVLAPYPDQTTPLNQAINQLYSDRPTPLHPDVCLGLLVPATAGSAFQDHGQRTQPAWYRTQQKLVAAGNLDKSLLPDAVPVRHTIVGSNERDYALRKAGLASPGKFGVTTLGCVPGDFKQVADNVPNTSTQDSVAFWYARRKGSKTPLLAETEGFRHQRFEAHGWDTYLLPARRKNFARFVHKVLDYHP